MTNLFQKTRKFYFSTLMMTINAFDKIPFHNKSPDFNYTNIEFESNPWPIFFSVNLFTMVINTLSWIMKINGLYNIFVSMFLLIFSLFIWGRDQIRESTFSGNHDQSYQKSVSMGFILFILSEVMLFFSFFIGFFYNFLSPSIDIGCFYPPVGISPIIPYYLPLSMTMILLYSSITVNWSLFALKSGLYFESIWSLLYTLFLGMLFFYFQFHEFLNSFFSISDGIYGSMFYLITSFHGMHVLLGCLMLFYNFYRITVMHFSTSVHQSMDLAVIYWHFVDLIWIIVMMFIYILGGVIL